VFWQGAGSDSGQRAEQIGQRSRRWPSICDRWAPTALERPRLKLASEKLGSWLISAKGPYRQPPGFPVAGLAKAQSPSGPDRQSFMPEGESRAVRRGTTSIQPFRVCDAAGEARFI
jgi:hypothetical protein